MRISDEKGSLLIMILGMLVMISLFASAVGYSVRQKTQVVKRLEDREALRGIAEAGVKKAMLVMNRKDNYQPRIYDALNQDWSSNEKAFKDIAVGKGKFSVRYEILPPSQTPDKKFYRYGIVDEERKININEVKSPLVLTRLFRTVGFAETDAHKLALSIFDWRDEDDNPDIDGAESQYYQELKVPYKPKNTSFDTLEELLYVKGMTPKILERIRPYLTCVGTNVININTASSEVLMAMGFSSNLADKLIRFRKGRDGTEGTKDDGVFKSTGDVVEAVNGFSSLAEDETASLTDFMQSGAFRVKSEFFTVQSAAELGGKNLLVQALIQREGEVILWQEKYSA